MYAGEMIFILIALMFGGGIGFFIFVWRIAMGLGGLPRLGYYLAGLYFRCFDDCVPSTGARF